MYHFELHPCAVDHLTLNSSSLRVNFFAGAARSVISEIRAAADDYTRLHATRLYIIYKRCKRCSFVSLCVRRIAHCRISPPWKLGPL